MYCVSCNDKCILPIKLPGHERTGCPLVPLSEGLATEVVMLPATQHVLGHWVHVVTIMLPSVIVVIAGRESITLASIVVRNNTFLRTSKITRTKIHILLSKFSFFCQKDL